MTIEQIMPWVFGLVSLFLLFGWIKDLIFYKKNFWDFSKDSGRNYIRYGTGIGGGGAKVPNGTRVKIAFPFMIFFLQVGAFFMWTQA